MGSFKECDLVMNAQYYKCLTAANDARDVEKIKMKELRKQAKNFDKITTQHAMESADETWIIYSLLNSFVS